MWTDLPEFNQVFDWPAAAGGQVHDAPGEDPVEDDVQVLRRNLAQLN